MKQIHRREKEQFEKLFKQEHIDRFEDRYRVLDVFLKTDGHVTAEDMVRLLNEKGYSLEPDFVRETLKLMCRFGFAMKNRFDNGHIRYEHHHLGQHHDHMICTKCRRIVEFYDDGMEDLQVRLASAHGFHLLQHRMEIYGICSDCLQERERLIPLDLAKPGERLVIRDFTGGTGARLRLRTMGLRIGDEIQIVTNLGKGQMAIAADYSRFVLGRGLAQKILVQSMALGAGDQRSEIRDQRSEPMTNDP